MWQFTGKQRPSFALAPNEAQESVWDYPRPPICDEDDREVVIRFQETELARTRRAIRVLETASPPTVYLPPEDIRMELLKPSSNETFCEWKGAATYWSLHCEDLTVRNCAWSYASPSPRFDKISGYVSFYPILVECWLGSERVQPQKGGFYGGWVTPEIVGPWKGESGTTGW